MPAPIVVVKAPSATSTKTQAAATAENAASAGLWPAVLREVWSRGHGRREWSGRRHHRARLKRFDNFFLRADWCYHANLPPRATSSHARRWAALAAAAGCGRGDRGSRRPAPRAARREALYPLTGEVLSARSRQEDPCRPAQRGRRLHARDDHGVRGLGGRRGRREARRADPRGARGGARRGRPPREDLAGRQGVARHDRRRARACCARTRSRRAARPTARSARRPREFVLYDQNGRVVDSARFRGKQVMLNFIYSRCPVANMCPLSTAKMMATQKLARESGVADIEFVSITLDPAYDTPGVLRDYADDRGIDTGNFSFLTGPEAAIRDLLTQFGVIAEFKGGHPRPHAGDAPHRREGPDRLEGRRERVGAEGVRGADAPMTGRRELPGPRGPRVAPDRGDHGRRRSRSSPSSASLPTGTNLSHMDFRVQGAQRDRVLRPGKSPVPARGRGALAGVALGVDGRGAAAGRLGGERRRWSSRPSAASRSRRRTCWSSRRGAMHLLIVDPSLDDYQHVHPRPGRRPGEWDFSFRPRFGGAYRIFADFTPVATNRGLYSETEMSVAGPPSPVAAGSQAPSWSAPRGRYRFELSPASRSRSGRARPRTSGSSSRATRRRPGAPGARHGRVRAPGRVRRADGADSPTSTRGRPTWPAGPIPCGRPSPSG